MYTAQADVGGYWSSSASPSAGHSYSLLFARNDQLNPSNRAFNSWANPVRCINCKPVESIAITGDVEGVVFTTDPNLTIGNDPETVTLTAGAPMPSDAKQPVRWHWEHAIGDDTSWIKIPDSDGKTTIVTSTHDDEQGIDYTMVGGKNRFRVVVSNGCSKVNSNVLEVSLKLPKLTYAIIGSGEFSWNLYRKYMLTQATRNTNGVLNPNNPNAVIKTAGLTELWSTTSMTTAANNLNNGVAVTLDGVYYPNKKPDILLYFSFGALPDWNATTQVTNIGNAIAEYVRLKGTVLFGAAADYDTYTAPLANMLNSIFPGTESIRQTPDDIPDSTYRIFDTINNDGLENDPIVNGPFGNLSGGDFYIGEENYGTFIVKNIPPGSVQIASMNHPRTNGGPGAGKGPLGTGTANYPEAWSFSWYNAEKNFFYIGDCTAISRPGNTDYAGYTAVYDFSATLANTTVTGAPGSKRFGYYSSTYADKVVHNAVLEMNALAWCMTRAARNGINPH